MQLAASQLGSVIHYEDLIVRIPQAYVEEWLRQGILEGFIEDDGLCQER